MYDEVKKMGKKFMIFRLFLIYFGIQSLEFVKTLYGSSVKATFSKSTFN